jgi:hypothetical protein
MMMIGVEAKRRSRGGVESLGLAGEEEFTKFHTQWSIIMVQ